MSRETIKLTPQQLAEHNLNVKVNQLRRLEKEVGALKYDGDKPDYSLLPTPALDEIAKVLSFGAQKYDKHNWRKGMDWSRVSAAAMRHITAWNNGEDLDKESGINHLAHAGCCIAFLLTYINDSVGTDDRYKNEKTQS